MKVILTTNIKKLGRIGELVKVKDGYARNYLFPKKMALRKNKKNLEEYEKIKEKIQIKENKRLENAKKLLGNIKKLKIEFKKEADENNQLYGSITKKEIINFLKEKEIKILADDININLPIRSLGEHQIEINPYVGIEESIKIFVNKN